MSTNDPYFDLSPHLGMTRAETVALCKNLNIKLSIAEKDRGDGRKAHYGAGRQPVDVIRELGFAPGFFAGNVLKYLRRCKDPEHSLESAHVYW